MTTGVHSRLSSQVALRRAPSAGRCQTTHAFRPRGFSPPRRFAPPAARGLVASHCRPWGSSGFRALPSADGPAASPPMPCPSELVHLQSRIPVTKDRCPPAVPGLRPQKGNLSTSRPCSVQASVAPPLRCRSAPPVALLGFPPPEASYLASYPTHALRSDRPKASPHCHVRPRPDAPFSAARRDVRSPRHTSPPRRRARPALAGDPEASTLSGDANLVRPSYEWRQMSTTSCLSLHHSKLPGDSRPVAHPKADPLAACATKPTSLVRWRNGGPGTESPTDPSTRHSPAARCLSRRVAARCHASDPRQHPDDLLPDRLPGRRRPFPDSRRLRGSAPAPTSLQDRLVLLVPGLPSPTYAVVVCATAPPHVVLPRR